MHKTINLNCICWVFSKIRHRLPALAALSVVSILGSLLSVIFALSTQDVIDTAVGGIQSEFFFACLGLGGLIFMRVLCNAVSIHLNEKLTADLDRDFKKEIIHKILHSEYAQISRYHSGDLVNRMNGDVKSVYSGILVVLSSAVSLITGLLTAVCVLLKMAPVFTAAIVLISAVLALFTLLIQKQMKILHKNASDANGKVSGFFQEIIEKLLMVQSLDVSEEIERRSDNLLEGRWNVLRTRKNLGISVSVGSNLLSNVGGFITLVWCANKLLLHEISFGELTAMTALVSQLQTPMLMLPAIIPKFASIIAASERLMEIENIPFQSGNIMEDCSGFYKSLTSISARNLTFSYGRNIVMENVDFTLPLEGLSVVVGSSGIGKSTLLKLLLGIYRPISGELVLHTKEGEIPVSRSTRSMFSYAPQGNLLLSGTLRENLLLSCPNATEEQIQRAVYVSAMDEYLAELPEGLDTFLGENGAGLSEGQAQRLSLARAILRGAPILLLDEVTSALDARTEEIVLTRIRELKERTCIAVTHRPAAIKLASWQLEILEEGVNVSKVFID